MLVSAASGVIARLADRVDRRMGWDRLPRLLGGLVLFGLRHRLRQRNLYDTPAADPPGPGKPVPPLVRVRTVDGRDNDVCDPSMGAVHTPFGRNGPAFPQVDSPPAHLVSEKLLTRHAFLPATSLNMLAAAWLQFEVHDWFQHRAQPDGQPYRFVEGGPLAAGTPPFATGEGSTPGRPALVSDQTHWWDASQLYGADRAFADDIRDDPGSGRVKVDDALLEAVENAMGRSPGPPVPNLWLGLALFHVVFAHEHNAICAALEQARPDLTGDALFDQARLINAALMAKIHTVEWTPAVIAHPTTEHAIRATWWGVMGERRHRRFGRIGSGEILSGIPGSVTRHDGVRYSLTEEFVAVYRMHPLLPDEVTFRRLGEREPMRLGEDGEALPFEQLTAAGGARSRPREWLSEIEPHNAFYSLGVANPGALALHNHPRFLQDLPQLDPSLPNVDVGARDIERTRESAVARYNDFRRIFRLAPATSFVELANGDQALAREIQDVYDDNLEDVDLMIGLFAERKPRGFAFSDTAFRVFLLMAARRLRSDRFLTRDFTEEVYTPTGMRWIRDTTMATILARHYPQLAPALVHVDNVFKPWPWLP